MEPLSGVRRHVEVRVDKAKNDKSGNKSRATSPVQPKTALFSQALTQESNKATASAQVFPNAPESGSAAKMTGVTQLANQVKASLSNTVDRSSPEVGAAPPTKGPLKSTVIYRETFDGQLSPSTRLQNGPKKASAFQFVRDPERGNVARIEMNRGEASEPTNSRVEVVNLKRFGQGKRYEMTWGVKLDANYKFDYKQSEIIGQIHQSSNDGSPPFAVVLKGDTYYANVRTSKKESDSQMIPLGQATPGRWDDWKLDWKASPNGDGYYNLRRNGAQVLNFEGTTSYNEPDAGYFKLGIYKWDWPKNKPSDVTERILFIDDITIREK